MFMGDHNTQKITTPNETRLTVAIVNFIISKGLSFNLSEKKGSIKCLIWQEMCQHFINL